jgi:hypothetical protein
MIQKAAIYNKGNTFISMKSCRRERSMGENSLVEYETDQIKENSRFNNSKQNLVYILSFVTLRFIYLYHKARKLKTGSFIQTTTTTKNNKDIYN